MGDVSEVIAGAGVDKQETKDLLRGTSDVNQVFKVFEKEDIEVLCGSLVCYTPTVGTAFILGHASNGVLGTSALGAGSWALGSVQRVVNADNTWYEMIRAMSFVDNAGTTQTLSFNNTTNSTATWDTTNHRWTFTGAPDSTATITGATWTAGNNNYALSFDGDDDYVDIGDLGLTADISLLTIAAWINVTDYSSNRCVISKREDASWSLFLRVTTEGKLRAQVNHAGGGNAIAETATAVMSGKTGEWHHVAMVKSATTLKIYLDGSEVATIASTDDIDGSTDSFGIGIILDGLANDFYGLMSDFRIWTDDLSAGEILSEYKSNVPILLTNLVCWIPISEGSGSTVALTNPQTIETTSIFLNSETVEKATVFLNSAVFDSSNFILSLSADGGTNWEEVTSDVEHIFTNTGTDLRFKVTSLDTDDINIEDANGTSYPIKISYVTA